MPYKDKLKTGRIQPDTNGIQPDTVRIKPDIGVKASAARKGKQERSGSNAYSGQTLSNLRAVLFSTQDEVFSE